jgi:hypothetical protein
MTFFRNDVNDLPALLAEAAADGLERKGFARTEEPPTQVLPFVYL